MKTSLSIITLFLITPLMVASQSADSLDVNRMEVGCPVVEKSFIKKNGKSTDTQELYLQCSVQDYFIKFCESNITRKELEKAMKKPVSFDIGIRDGSWDICEGDPEMQSRVGLYAVIYKILD